MYEEQNERGGQVGNIAGKKNAFLIPLCPFLRTMPAFKGLTGPPFFIYL